MILPLQLTPEVWTLALLVIIIVFYRSTYTSIARLMDRLTGSPPRMASKGSSTKSGSSDANVVTAQSSSSPRISFYRRLRSSISSPPAEPAIFPRSPLPANNNMSRSEAAKAAKRLILSNLRDDWTYPPGDISDSFTPPAPQILDREPMFYRRRTEASSDSEQLPEMETYGAPDPLAFQTSGPYRFENPDAVAVSISDRKRKRRRRLQEELEWNEGLRTWTECRDAWCGAIKQRPQQTNTGTSGLEKRNQVGSRNDLALESSETDTTGSQPLSPSPFSPLSTRSYLSAASSPDSPSSVSPTTSFPSQAEGEEYDKEELKPEPSNLSPPASSSPPDAILPIYPSLLPPSHPIRAAIKPAAYPAIYSKVVLQSLTPTVPIPLPDVIGALVVGWKSEGNWPPKTGTVATTGSIPLSPTALIQEGGRRASELLKFRRRSGTGNGAAAAAAAGAGGAGAGGGGVKGLKSLKGVGAMRKVLGLRDNKTAEVAQGQDFHFIDEEQQSTESHRGWLRDGDPEVDGGSQSPRRSLNLSLRNGSANPVGLGLGQEQEQQVESGKGERSRTAG